MRSQQAMTTHFQPATALERETWLRCLDADDSATLWQHPDVLQPSRRDGEPDPLLFHHTSNGSIDATSESLGVLAGKVLRVAAPLGLSRQLKGHRLVGDRLVGHNTGIAVETFAEQVACLIASRVSDFVLVEELDVESPLRAALTTAAEQRGLMTFAPVAAQPHWSIRFPENPENYWQKFSSKSRSEFRRRARRFEHTFERVTRAEDVPAFLDACRAICERSWKMRHMGLRITADAREQTMFSQIAERGGFRGCLLSQGEVPVAFNIVVKSGRRLTWQETGFDDRFASDSPGQILFWLMLHDLITQDRPLSLDLGFGDGRHKQLFGNHRTVTAPLVVCRNDPATVLAVTCRDLQRWIGRQGRQALHHSGLHRFVRRRIHAATGE
jgi:CelD/BcsL family acetyltransferase involved in cellulose biosynthesis